MLLKLFTSASLYGVLAAAGMSGNFFGAGCPEPGGEVGVAALVVGAAQGLYLRL